MTIIVYDTAKWAIIVICAIIVYDTAKWAITVYYTVKQAISV